MMPSEPKGKSAVITFGRFNPPTTGHEKLVDAVMSAARKRRADHFIYPSRTNDKKKNPLSAKDKVFFMKKFFPKANIVDDDSIKTVFMAIHDLIRKGYTEITLVVGSDRVSEFESRIGSYVNSGDMNNIPLDHFEVISAGQRDPDAEGVSGMSASKMRAAVISGDVDEFMTGIPKRVPEKYGMQMFNLLKKNMGIKEAKEETVKKTILMVSNTKRSDTIKKLMASAKSAGHTPVFVRANAAFIGDVDGDIMIIENNNGKGTHVVVDRNHTIAFVRGSAIKTQAGKSLIEQLGQHGVGMINPMAVFDLTNNKYATHLMFQKYGIRTPRTAIITNEASIKTAHERIGGKYPVIIKALQGAEGIGVSKVDSEESYVSVVQALRKSGEEFLVQEMMDIDSDIRTIIMDGKIVASMKRLKATGDFRTNKALGAESEPYSLSEDEKKFVKEIAKKSGAVYAGIDHAVVNGELYAIEVNASPGSGAQVYTHYVEDEEDGTITGDQLVESIVKHALEMPPPVPQLKLGRVEMLSVGKSNVKGRVDSGNSTFSVLDARDIKVGKSTVTFTFEGNKYTKEIVDVSNVHSGAGNTETRPVIEMSIMIGKKEFHKVKFSLTDRVHHVYPVLLGNEFMKENNVVVHTNEVYMQSLEERTLTPSEIDKKDEVLSSLKKKAKDFKKRYGKDYKSVMYGTATKIAKNEDATEESIDFENPPIEGTDEIVSRYKKMTPGEVNEIATRYFSSLGEHNDRIKPI